MPPKVPKALDFSKTEFLSNGNKYHFYLDTISNTRLERFLQLTPQIKFGMNHMTVHKLLLQLWEKLEKIRVDTFINDIRSIQDLVFNKLKLYEGINAEEVTQRQIDLIWEFSCLYILGEDEDATSIDERVFKKKIEDWKTDQDFNSFFFLHKFVSNTFPIKLDLSSLQEVLNNTKQNTP